MAAAHRAQHLESTSRSAAASRISPLERSRTGRRRPDPEQSALAGDRRRQIAAALAALPAEAREILVLREIEDLSVQAHRGGARSAVGTVMSRLARAREKLAAELRGRLGRRDHGLPDL